MAEEKAPSSTTSTLKTQANRVRNFFSIPAPIKKVFDSVPVYVYTANELPARAPRSGKKASLYVFCNDEDVRSGRPSFNPGCLKWQTFLKIAGVEHDLVSSNNHASPTGVLPFLLPALQLPPSAESILPIPSSKLVKYAAEHGKRVREPLSMRHEAYKSLLNHRIRCAWLYNLYLSPSNSSISTHLYVNPTSSNPLVRMAISRQLRSAAEAELLKQGAVIDVNDLYAEAEKAFEALSILLGDYEWFLPAGDNEEANEKTEAGPTIFDAEVFAYTHLLLDERIEWQEQRLVRALKRCQNLVQHRERVLKTYYRDV